MMTSTTTPHEFDDAAAGADWYGVAMCYINGRKLTDGLLYETIQQLVEIGCPIDRANGLQVQLEATYGVYFSASSSVTVH